jgi:hypothetical protein
LRLSSFLVQQLAFLPSAACFVGFDLLEAFCFVTYLRVVLDGVLRGLSSLG